MDLALYTRNRLKQIRLSPRNLARATRMTESYIARLPKPNSSQTVPNRTDMNDQLERVLKLPQGHLAMLADPAAPAIVETCRKEKQSDSVSSPNDRPSIGYV